MLAALLLNAGLGVQTSQLRNLVRSPRFLSAGLAANLLIPVTFIFAVSQVLRLWHNNAEAQEILVGLALVAAMPIAGSSTAWTQNANGDLALSLGLVLFSTFLSPLTTPLVFDLVELMASGDYADALEDLESKGSGVLLIFCVLLPVLLGIVLHFFLGTNRVDAVKPVLKLANSTNLLLLNFSNAAVSLPQTITEPDCDFLAVTLAIVLALLRTGLRLGLRRGSNVESRCAAAGLTHVRPGHEQQRHWFGIGVNGAGRLSARVFAGDLLQPASAPGSRHSRFPAVAEGRRAISKRVTS